MKLIILIIVDNPSSWIIPYALDLNLKLNKNGYDCKLIHTVTEIIPSDVMFILGCEKMIKDNYLSLNKHNIVIHESALPKGKGWSPLTWQVLEGVNEIPFTLFEAEGDVDSGDIYIQEYLKLNGDELNNELKYLQGKKTIEMCEGFLQNYKNLKKRPQIGESSFYSRRTIKDSELDIKKTIEEQFNLLRACDNENYPAFFYHNNKKYIIKIYQE